MFRSVLVLAAGMLAAEVALAQTPRVPYLATVQERQTYVRSGPGQHYYPTGVLKQGAVVEVYRHDPGGWLAIRPPVGSFSWVRADAVQLVDADVGQIVRDGEVARIGSSLSRVRELWQVKLRKGEKVAIIQRVDEEQGSWYQIEPPAGEFRWIYHRAVVPLDRDQQQASSAAAVPESSTGADVLSSSAVTSRDVLQASAQGVPAVGQFPLERGAPALPVDSSMPPSRQLLPGAPGPQNPLVPVTQTGPEASRPLPSPPQGAAPGNQPRASALEAVESQLDRLDLELSHQVCRPRQQWELEPLRRRAEQLVAAAEHPTVRARARELLRRIERFELIRQARLELLHRHRRLQQLAAVQEPLAAKRASSGENSPRQTPAPDRAGSPSPQGWTAATPRRYDARGQLVPVRARGFDGPHYAVVDPATGKVRAYVSGAPGVDLRRFVGRTVGVIGIQEVVPRLNAKHVAARRVELLDSAPLRR